MGRVLPNERPERGLSVSGVRLGIREEMGRTGKGLEAQATSDELPVPNHPELRQLRRIGRTHSVQVGEGTGEHAP